MSIKKNCNLMLISGIAFLLFACGQNNASNENQEQSSQAGSEQSTAEASLTGNPIEGKTYFMQTCSACHGPDAKGLPKLGKDLTTSQFVTEKTSQELFKFIEVGRLPTDPLNTTGVAMPPKGGNPAYTDQQIMDIVSFVKSIHQ